jgi:antirestriction protein ArdC
LVAELSACYVLGALDAVDPRGLDQSAAYLAAWTRALNEDPHMFVWAASRAARAAERILGEHGDGAADADTQIVHDEEVLVS